MQARGFKPVQAAPISTRFLGGTFHLNSIFVQHGSLIECDLIYQLSQLEPKKDNFLVNNLLNLIFAYSYW